MEQSEFLFEFTDIRDGLHETRLVTAGRSRAAEFKAGIDDSQLARLSRNLVPPQFADAVDLALAVSVGDRLAYAPPNVRRQIEIHLPVRHPEILNNSWVLAELQERLYEFTHDDWAFSFTHRRAPGRLSELQVALPNFHAVSDVVEVALWSGGLDATAGLYHRLKKAPSASRFTLFGTGVNSYILRRQHEVVSALRLHCPQFNRLSFGLTQVPILLSGTTRVRKNAAPRARGFVFLLLGAVCTAMEDQSTLYIYESGVGALNLPLRSSEVGLDHSRAVHPVQIRRMGTLVSRLLEVPLAFCNPFEFVTKAELCREIARDAIIPVIAETISCDRRQRAVPMQCGCCSSCILRRQALAVNGIVEPPTTYLVTNNPMFAKRVEQRGISHLPAMLAQVSDLRQDVATASGWTALKRRYPDLLDTAEEMARTDGTPLATIEERLVRLYSTYAFEWDTARLAESCLQPT